MVDLNITGTENDRDLLQTLATKAHMSQSDFMMMLLHVYGEELVKVRWEKILGSESEQQGADGNR